MKLHHVVIGWTVACACGDSTDMDRVAMTETNGLGVVALTTERFDSGGDEVFELRGLDANDVEVAKVRLRTGYVADLATYLPQSEGLGSEVVLSANGAEQRLLSAGTEIIVTGNLAAEIESFLRITAVSSLLERDAHIVVDLPPASVPDETALWTATCSSSMLNTSPLAKQCCYGEWPGSFYRHTMFVNPSGAVVMRPRNSHGTGCRASDGTSTCSGTSCYFGPNANAGATVTPPPGGTPYAKIYTQSVFPAPPLCGYQWYSTPQTPVFSDVTGSFPTGVGCCINGAGPCNGPYQACDSCGGGGSAGAGYWD
jgi:hypothetical protein